MVTAPRRSLLLGSLLGALLWAPIAQGQVDDEQPVPPPDTGVPGPWVTYATPPLLARETRACSMRLPLCVHSAGNIPGRQVLDVLASAERAWSTLTGALDLPPPDVDQDDLRYHVYLVDPTLATARRGVTYPRARDVRSRIDRARAFSLIDSSMHAGCNLDAVVTREVARAVLYRAAPATAEGIARAHTTYLAQLVAPCALAFAVEEASAFQSRPDRTVCDAEPEAGASADGASLFWSRIDWAYGRQPGAIILGQWALAPSMTDVGAQRWHDEPDAFDVLRVSFKNALSTNSTISDLLLDTAVARAFMGSADDGLHQPETRTLGDAAKVPLDWNIEWPAKPRRLSHREPVQPSGASYVVVRRDGAPKGARLRVEIAWEEHSLFRWAFVKLDAQGRELGRVPIATRERATEAQATLVDLDNVDRVLLVGVNVGDPAYRFDPDDEVWEPHGWLLTIAAE